MSCIGRTVDTRNKELTVLVKAKELVDYTLNITDNTKYFPKKARFSFVNRMQNLSIDICTEILKTNEIPIKYRRENQINILSNIKVLLLLVELSLNKGYINEHQCEIWTRKCLDVKYLVAAWMNRTR